MMSKRFLHRLTVLVVLLAAMAVPLLRPPAVMATAPDRPSNLNPDHLATGISLTPTLQASAFNDPEGHSPQSSDWRIADVGSFPGSGGDITTCTVPPGYLQYGKVYSWQVQYKDSNGDYSDWSLLTSFETVAAPHADFTASPTTAEAGDTIHFTSSATGGSGLDYEWSFGDTGSSTNENPDHVYTSAGTYTVSLTVTDEDGPGSHTETKNNYITITAPPLEADFTASPTSAIVGQSVGFTATASGGVGTLSYQWDFDNNGSTDSNVKNPSYAYGAPGVYTVKLTVADSDTPANAEIVTKTAYITVAADLVADFISDKQLASLGQPVVFTATASGGVGDLSYQWDFDNNGTWDSTVQNPSYVYPTVGQKTVKLVVTDEATPTHNTEAVIKTSYVTVALGLTADFSADRTEVALGQAVKFTSLTAGIVGTATYEWDFNNDGTVDSTEKDPSYTYVEQGTFTVVLKVTDTVGTIPVTKNNYIKVTAALLADFAADRTAVAVGGVVKFTSSAGGGVAPLTYDWDLNGDGKSDSSVQNPSFTYTTAGSYKVSLKVTDSTGKSDTETKDKYITVSGLIQADFTASATSVGPGQAVTFAASVAGGTPPITYAWDFNGDDVVDNTSEQATYTYAAAGVYTVQLKVTDSAGNADIEKKTGFIMVGDVAVAPCPIPQGGGVIQTADGRVFTTFPAGAYTGDATLNILEVSRSTAPKAPDGYQIGSACFDIEATDGTGRVITSLVRTATIAIKYAPSDLSAAGRNGANLKLAYYTPATGKWTIESGTVFNDTSQTLSATTNHFGTWAILVKPQSGGLAWWAKALIVVAALAGAGIVGWKAFSVKQPERWTRY